LAAKFLARLSTRINCYYPFTPFSGGDEMLPRRTASALRMIALTVSVALVVALAMQLSDSLAEYG
jgi:hypothetical protein